MAEIARPPRDITTEQFFREWLPSQAAAVQPAPTPVTVRVRLDGEGGGAWDLSLGEAGLRVAAPDGSEPTVTIVQSVQDFRAIVVGEEGAASLSPQQASAGDFLMMDRQGRELVQQVKGTIRFEVSGFNGRTWAATVKLGEHPMPAAPDTTVTVDADTYSALLARALTLPQAYFTGKIRIQGDANLAMQVGMAMMPRFS